MLLLLLLLITGNATLRLQGLWRGYVDHIWYYGGIFVYKWAEEKYHCSCWHRHFLLTRLQLVIQVLSETRPQEHSAPSAPCHFWRCEISHPHHHHHITNISTYKSIHYNDSKEVMKACCGFVKLLTLHTTWFTPWLGWLTPTTTHHHEKIQQNSFSRKL